MAVGVKVETGVRAGASEFDPLLGSAYFVTGLTERGPTDAAVRIESMAQYEDLLGGRVAYGALYDDLEMFFAEGGSRAYVARVVGPAATTGLLVLNDRATAAQPTVRLTARNPGAWSTSLTVQVVDGAVANTFSVLVSLDGNLVEAFRELADPAALVAAVNNASAYLTATNLGSPTAAPGNNPAVLAATALSAGADDRASVVAATLTAALARFTADLGPGAVAIPGQTSANVGAALVAHAKANERIALLATALGQSVAQAKVSANALRNVAGSEHAGLFYPWVVVPDAAGGTRTISPEGYVAAVRARAFRAAGPWRAPAGTMAAARHVVGLERELTAAEVDDLNDSRVNPLRPGPTRLYGWRSLSLQQAVYVMLSDRDVLNVVAERVRTALEPLAFAPVDRKGHFLAGLEGSIRAILEPMRTAGGLYERVDPASGEMLDPGYSIDTGANVNPPEQLATNEVRAEVGLRLSPVGELIRVTITRVAFDVSL